MPKGARKDDGLDVAKLMQQLEVVHRPAADEAAELVLHEPPRPHRPTREKIQAVLGDAVRIRDLGAYIEACTHKSAQDAVGYCQERLEHLGDAILAACVTSLLYQRFPLTDEGALSRLRTKIVNGKTLASIGRSMRLQDIIVVDSFAASATLHDKVYEDTLEALVGAVFADLGFDEAQRFVKDVVERHLPAEYLFVEDNYKDVLRRYARLHRLRAPRYASAASEQGGENACTCSVWSPHGQLISKTATDASKRHAEMEAARAVLIELGYDVDAERFFAAP